MNALTRHNKHVCEDFFIANYSLRNTLKGGKIVL